MVSFTKLAFALLSITSLAIACDFCQCQDASGGHCCALDPIDRPCDEACAATGCNANGASNCISRWTDITRHQCYN